MRTLIIYVNDNGWEQPPFVDYAGDNILYSNGGPKGKLSLHDQAFRAPIILHWPGVIQPGVFERELLSTVDIAPTILDYAGAQPPSWLPGFSIRPIVEGRASSHREALIGRVTQRRSEDSVMGRPTEGYYLRTPRWYFIWFADEGAMELVDMVEDPEANHNVIAENDHLAAGFPQAIRQWKARALSSAPTPRPKSQ